MRIALPILTALALSACVSAPDPRQAPPPPPRPAEQTQVPPTRAVVPVSAAGVPAPRILEGPGLDGIIRQNAGVVMNRFGEPRLTVVEGDMRKLQFVGAACVLDVFLYPLTPGGEPVATWVEARRASDGAAVDRLACIQALSR